MRDYTGHGVHTSFHSGLVILHYDEPRLDTVMKPGMTFTIEPMLTLGTVKTQIHRAREQMCRLIAADEKS